MQNRWSDASDDPIEQLVHQSRLVGMEEDLVLWGGGNNSVKSSATDLLGRPIEVMYIKSSGSDMKSIVPKQFPAVRLDYIAPLRARDEEMSDQEMVDYLAKCLIDPASARPSIETLLHAFLPATAMLHTHADAILSLTNTRGREQTVRDCFGDAVIVVPYRRPGFRLSRDVADAFDAHPAASGLVLMNHGLITWGDTVQEAYERHIALVTRAEEFVTSGAARWAGASSNSTIRRRRSSSSPARTPRASRRSGPPRPIISSIPNATPCFSTKATTCARSSPNGKRATRPTTTPIPASSPCWSRCRASC